MPRVLHFSAFIIFSLVFHNVPSLYPSSFWRSDFYTLYNLSRKCSAITCQISKFINTAYDSDQPFSCFCSSVAPSRIKCDRRHRICCPETVPFGTTTQGTRWSCPVPMFSRETLLEPHTTSATECSFSQLCSLPPVES